MSDSRDVELAKFDSIEPIPDTLMYRSTEDAFRPTIQDLRFGKDDQDQETEGKSVVSKEEEDDSGAVKFGTWDGVYARCLLNIFGVIMFLRLGWIVGQAGIFGCTMIILMSQVVTTVTALSMSAISTNGVVKGGGAYFMISRSLGPQFGGAIGLLFSVANAVAVALYIVGFAETVVSIQGFEMTPGQSFDLQIWGLIILVILLIVALIGVDWVIKMDMFLLVLLVAAILNFFIGTFALPANPATGHTAYGGTTFADNWGPGYTGSEGFFSVLSVFFPAVTGIMAGANISGDLKDPQVNIPLGTLSAVGTSSVVYVVMAWCLGATVTRGADVGLIADNLVIEKISLWGPLVIIGIFAATLSSALASLVGAPRIFQAVCKDNLFPALSRFGQGYGANDEPRQAYIATFVIAAGCIMIGQLNVIAALITEFFLISYALVNYACFAATLSKSPGWRPSFKYFNPYVAMCGCIFCIAIMVLIDPVASLIAIVIGAMIFKYLDFKDPDVNWGSASAARLYVNTIRGCLRLRSTKDHVKVFRPQYLYIMREDESLEELQNVHNMVTFLKKGKGIFMYGYTIVGEFHSMVQKQIDMSNNTHLVENKIPAFNEVVIAPSRREGARQLMQLAGLGKLRHNTILMSFIEEWWKFDPEVIRANVEIIEDAFDLNKGVGVFRNLQKLDLKEPLTGSVDVYWLVDDGGLTLLLPFILQLNDYFKNTSFKLYTLMANDDLTAETVRMTRLLRKFRIVGEVNPISDWRGDPSQETIDEFLSIQSESRKPGSKSIVHDEKGNVSIVHEDGVGEEVELTEDEADLIAKSKRYLRLSEIIRKNTMASDLAVITLPVPKSTDDPFMYMSWLEIMSIDMPPTVFVRGNQQNVLTFYS